MSKAVLISIHPKWCEKIASGEKTIEVRKTRPKIETPFKCYIYCAEPNTKNPWKLLEIHSSDGKIHKGNGKVIGEFVCDWIEDCWYPFNYIPRWATNPLYYNETDCSTVLTKLGCLSIDEIWEYGKGKTLYGWHISDLKIYDEPKELSEFGLKRPPQSWCYVEK